MLNLASSKLNVKLACYKSIRNNDVMTNFLKLTEVLKTCSTLYLRLQ
jgi:hypothetical protein